MKNISPLAKLAREQNWELFQLDGHIANIKAVNKKVVRPQVPGSHWVRSQKDSYVESLENYRKFLVNYHKTQRIELRAKLNTIVPVE